MCVCICSLLQFRVSPFISCVDLCICVCVCVCVCVFANTNKHITGSPPRCCAEMHQSICRITSGRVPLSPDQHYSVGFRGVCVCVCVCVCVFALISLFFKLRMPEEGGITGRRGQKVAFCSGSGLKRNPSLKHLQRRRFVFLSRWGENTSCSVTPMPVKTDENLN